MPITIGGDDGGAGWWRRFKLAYYVGMYGSLAVIATYGLQWWFGPGWQIPVPIEELRPFVRGWLLVAPWVLLLTAAVLFFDARKAAEIINRQSGEGIGGDLPNADTIDSLLDRKDDDGGDPPKVASEVRTDAFYYLIVALSALGMSQDAGISLWSTIRESWPF